MIELFYDASCAFCVRNLTVLRRYDDRSILVYYDASNSKALETLRDALGELPDLNHSMWALQAGKGYEGYNAFRVALLAIHRLRWLGVLMGIPPIVSVGPYLYRLVASNRRHLGCRATCSNSATAPVDQGRDTSLTWKGVTIVLRSSAMLTLVLSFLASTQGARAQAPAPTATPSAKAAVAEDPAVTSQAKAFYASVISGKIDRSKLSSELNTALSDSIVTTLSTQLGALGRPTWQYLKQVKTPIGAISVYKLGYNAVTLYMTFGVSKGGTISSVSFLRAEPPG